MNACYSKNRKRSEATVYPQLGEEGTWTTDPTASRSSRSKARWLCRLASLTRWLNVPGQERLLRLLHHPDRRQTDHFEVIAPYGRHLHIYCNTASFIEWQILFHGYYEPEIGRLLLRLLGPNSIALDVGANIGCHALTMSTAADHSVKVYAFEPHPRVFARLAANIALNPAVKVEATNCALGAKAGEITLYAPAAAHPQSILSSVHAGVLRDKVPPGSIETFKVSVRTLDSFVRDLNIERLNLIKVDVEGHELQVLQGAAESLTRFQPRILFELSVENWHRAGYDFDDIAEFFESLGYRLFEVEHWSAFLFPLTAAKKYGNILAVPRSGAKHYQ